ncbi:MAG TPA: hypothetical protein PK018_10660 [Candidatus Competibacter sp.]|nr:hypothetical protein [Candidatus Competibacteraceae bacterium]HPE72608.1 hypothetical protein [Candidatus Competibacter sp.]HRW66948.1 hypothetical protein [Candidatus Competibacter sp.]
MKTLNLTKTTLALGLLASLAIVNSSQAGGSTWGNGMDLNGVRLNGTSPTTLASNGSNGFVVSDIVLPNDRKGSDRKTVYRRPGRPR